MVKTGKATQGKWQKTSQTGISYREHPERKYGTRADRYYRVRFKVAGKQITECYGWASEGWTLKKVASTMTEMKHELKSGVGSGKLADRRKRFAAKEKEVRKAEAAKSKLETSYADYFHNTYWPDVIQDKKEAALQAEASLHRSRILPVIGEVPVRSIGELHIVKLSRETKMAGKSPRTIEYTLACARMVLNHAIRTGFHPGPNPVTTLPRNSRPKFDNKKLRFLSRDEADELLAALKARSVTVHNMTILSLYCGARAKEIFSLTWGDIDLDQGIITLRNTKNSDKTRHIPMSTTIKEMFSGMEPGCKSALVFPDGNGRKRKQMSKTFARTIEDLGFNKGVTDRRYKFTFHNCRHTYASWLVHEGVPLYTVMKVMGHSTIALTERYAHLAPDAFSMATAAIERRTADRGSRRKVVNITNGLE